MLFGLFEEKKSISIHSLSTIHGHILCIWEGGGVVNYQLNRVSTKILKSEIEMQQTETEKYKAKQIQNFHSIDKPARK